MSASQKICGIRQPIKRLMIGWIAACFVTITSGLAQDTIHYEVESRVAGATQDYLPHWLTANRFGILNDADHSTGLLRGKATYERRLTKRWQIGAGVDLIAKVPFSKTLSPQAWLQQGYVSVQYGIFKLMGGRQEQTLGTPDRELSTGSLAISGNARPIPQLLLSVPKYSSVPFTRGWVKFKGTYRHGWLGEDRFISGALLHEKSLYVKLGGDFFVNLAGGLIHTVVWAGEDPRFGPLPAGLKDYWQVIRGKEAKVDQINNPLIAGEAANALGDNMGVYDFSLAMKSKHFCATIYQQTPFEDWTGSRLFKNRDRLLGLHVVNQQPNAWLSSIVYEFVSTTYQSGPSRPGGIDPDPGTGPKEDRLGLNYGGRDNYYNNAIYKTGWTYQDRILGTPLFYTIARMQLYVPGFDEPDLYAFNFNIVNNRVVAHHVGIAGQVKRINYKLLATFTNNLGTYGGLNGGITEWGSIDNPDAPYAFRPPQRQNYFLLEVESHPFSAHWSLLTSLAVDAGQLTDNVGVLVGLRRVGMWTRKQQLQP